MKKPINPAVAIVAVIIVVAVAVALGWKQLGPRTDGPDKPIDMGKAMGGAANSGSYKPANTSGGAPDMSKIGR